MGKLIRAPRSPLPNRKPNMCMSFLLKIPALIGGILQVASIAIFIYVICRTYFSSGKEKYEVYEGFLLSSYLWFILQAIAFVALYFHFTVVGNKNIPEVFK